MTRFELLHLLIAQARANGFEFRKWYVSRLGLRWQGSRQAVETLSFERRYYALLFSHEFASSFWKPGTQITFQVPAQSFTRRMADGSIATVTRKSFTRRSTRTDAWLYHLRELAASEDPLRTMRKYLRVEDDLEADPPLRDDLPDDAPELASSLAAQTHSAAQTPASTPLAKPAAVAIVRKQRFN
jgi:hypothetical protein